VSRNLEHQAKYGYGLYSVILKSTGVLIGDCGLEKMELPGGPVAELGYDFRSDHWHQGYATEAACAVRDYAFEVLALPRLVSLIRVGNEASKRVAERVGMGLVAEIMRYSRQYWEYAIDRSLVGGGGA
jgi:RimJ/RimL family protein N-acetyltransferase